MRSAEIAQYIGRSSRYVSSYLSYWKTRGFVEYENGYWYLTQKGEEYVKLLISRMKESNNPRLAESLLLVQKLLSERVSSTINSRAPQGFAPPNKESLSFIAEKTGSRIPEPSHKSKNISNCIKKLLDDKLDEDEKEVLETLVKHYVEWGSSYVYLEQLSKMLGYDYSELIQLLKQLQVKKLIYIYTDRRFGMRVGLNRSFRKLLDLCLNSG